MVSTIQDATDKLLKVERHCPRCRAYFYHTVLKWARHNQFATIKCAQCGHSWKGRLRRDERAFAPIGTQQNVSEGMQ